MTASGAWRWIPRGIVLGLLAFAIFGPIANLALWAVAERWYWPHALPSQYGFEFWGRVFSRARPRLGLARHQRDHRAADRRRVAR